MPFLERPHSIQGTPGLVWRGAWDSGTIYALKDAVYNDNVAYICILGHTNQEPPNATYWDVLAAAGEPGPQGEQGPPGTPGMVWKGTWDADTTYEEKDVVENDGSAYICILGNTNKEPPNATYWELVASKGDTGPQGPEGDPGDPGLEWKGAWSSETAYVENDGVSHSGSSYICVLGNTNKEPPNETYWNLLAEKGASGEGTGDVIGPASATVDNIAVFGASSGKEIKDGGKKLSELLQLGETETTAYRGDRGKTAYDHSQVTTGAVHGATTVGNSLFRLTNPSAITFIKINADNTVTAQSDSDFRTSIGAGTSNLTLGETSATAYRGDYGKTAYDHSQVTSGAVHGATTVGNALFRLTNPSAITFLRVNADNTATARSAADFRDDIGAAPKNPAINAQTDSYTLALTDDQKLVTVDSADAETVTVPPNSSVAFPVGALVTIYRKGAGAVSIAAGDGVTLRKAIGLKLKSQYSVAQVWKIATDEWIVYGDVEA